MPGHRWLAAGPLLALGACCLGVVAGRAGLSPDAGTPAGPGTGCSPDSGITLYAASPDSLYRIDPVTWAPTLVGAFGVDAMTDLAVSPSSEIYVTSYTTLYKVDAVAAGVTPVLQHDDGLNALTFLADGTLLGAAGDGSVWKLDLAKRTAEPLGNFGSGLSSSGDLIAVAEGTIYGTALEASSPSPGDFLVRVNPSTGAATTVGPIGFSSVWGLAYYGGAVIAFTSQGEVLRIDIQTGAGTLLASSRTMYYGAGVSPAVAANCP